MAATIGIWKCSLSGNTCRNAHLEMSVTGLRVTVERRICFFLVA